MWETWFASGEITRDRRDKVFLDNINKEETKFLKTPHSKVKLPNMDLVIIVLRKLLLRGKTYTLRIKWYIWCGSHLLKLTLIILILGASECCEMWRGLINKFDPSVSLWVVLTLLLLLTGLTLEEDDQHGDSYNSIVTSPLRSKPHPALPSSSFHKNDIAGEMVVKTDLGSVRGRVIKVTKTEGLVGGFLGLPYAQPPIHNLRFRVSYIILHNI